MILGASGRLGGDLFKRFKEDSFEISGTYCTHKKNGMIPFNLEEMILENILTTPKPSHVIIAAAANPRPELSKDLTKSYESNVPKTKKLIEDCFSKKIIPIYLSTDNVFDGEKGDYKEGDRTNPLNNYGKMKCEIENHLLNSNKPFILIRMGKVFGIQNDETLFKETFEKMQIDKKIICSKDQIFTPLYSEDFYEFIKQAVQNNYHGVFHLASTLPITRYEIAEKIKNYFKMDAEIVPCKINEIGLSEKRPLKIDLNVEKYKRLTGNSQKPIENFLNLIN